VLRLSSHGLPAMALAGDLSMRCEHKRALWAKWRNVAALGGKHGTMLLQKPLCRSGFLCAQIVRERSVCGCMCVTNVLCRIEEPLQQGWRWLPSLKVYCGMPVAELVAAMV
jgi:hypothetical protein